MSDATTPKPEAPKLPPKLTAFWWPVTEEWQGNNDIWINTTADPEAIANLIDHRAIPVEIDTAAAGKLAKVEGERDHLLKILMILNAQMNLQIREHEAPASLEEMIAIQFSDEKFKTANPHPSHIRYVRRIAGLPEIEETSNLPATGEKGEA